VESSAALEEGGRHSRGMLWGMGQMGPVLVSVSFTLKSVTKLNSVKHLRSRTHLDTVVRAPALCVHNVCVRHVTYRTLYLVLRRVGVAC
jgi:hypothetical protein